jgi:NADH:ubiquinone oxidoreductase subunit K
VIAAATIRLPFLLFFSAVLFSAGVYGVLARRNAVLVLMSIELMLNAVNVNLVAFNAYLRDALLTGQIFALFVITVAAAEVGIGLAVVILIYRNRETINVDEVNLLKW